MREKIQQYHRQRAELIEAEGVHFLQGLFQPYIRPITKSIISRQNIGDKKLIVMFWMDFLEIGEFNLSLEWTNILKMLDFYEKNWAMSAVKT